MRLFISYRRSDSRASTGRLYDTFSGAFSSAMLYKDVDDLPYGRDFREEISKAIENSFALVAVIGPDWLATTGEGFRIQNENDPVRFEIAKAVERNIPIFPVLVDGATMPNPDHLPHDIRAVAFINSPSLDHDSWRRDVQPLVEAIGEARDAAEGEATASEASGGANLEAGATATESSAQDAAEREVSHVSEDAFPQPGRTPAADDTQRRQQLLASIGFCLVDLIALKGGVERGMPSTPAHTQQQKLAKPTADVLAPVPTLIAAIKTISRHAFFVSLSFEGIPQSVALRWERGFLTEHKVWIDGIRERGRRTTLGLSFFITLDDHEHNVQLVSSRDTAPRLLVDRQLVLNGSERSDSVHRVRSSAFARR